MTVQLRTYDSEQAQKILEDLVRVYLEIHATPPTPFQNEDRYRRQLAGHLTNPGWKLVTATENGELIGYAYGFPLPPHTRWWEGLQTPVPDGFTAEDGRRTFAISEIMVRLPWRRQGVARMLHEALVSDVEGRRMTLLVEPDNLPARTAYTRWGYREVADLRPGWENAPTFTALVLPR
ncbi:GNAT family N-acetyltransferase [Micromonospora cathayae]|uniref:GNAT family N-acetyltransferase n=1 Tax=Micromonospora cathayae TaxID=3028804 RepID=A0ABY7ZMZ6_9ACTN|nr:GNAT family N-acetyltransferase [Micromonospora sp. HUAS 3]WDZ84395.1 GNAT family N-acetyltransferase [Micromonospora sp. HUAS 3]